MNPSDFIKENWSDFGPYVVGVNADCNCPTEIPEAQAGETIAYPDRPHEAHDIIPALFEDQLPEGMTMEKWRLICKLIAIAPELWIVSEKLREMDWYIGCELRREDHDLLEDARQLAFKCAQKMRDG